GLDYYTRTAFEFTAEGLGSQNAVGGGGRYDGLAESLGGPSLPGIGFGLGVERIALAMESKGVDIQPRLDVFIVTIGDQARSLGFRLAPQLRDAGFSTDMDHAGRAMKGQFKPANNRNAAWVIVIGEQELAAGKFTVKHMQTGDEEALPPSRIVGYLAVRS
ncbi:MAG TPA: His/Gly/Thr/Pro-type tRNA ligase C-terminal domain-containing protein, partial [Actinomycetota bacterium]|nr:His/Gly/Thr/Pro-type tRNA ligase C-terminal domain-containing protein [Actinomycetota bacterium]